MHSRLTSLGTPFVGRQAELAGLVERLGLAGQSQGGVVLIAGEPGIGKTRIAEELAWFARERGAQVLWGRCWEGEGAPAFWPWVQVVRAYVHDQDPRALLTDLGPGAAEIAELVPAVRERLPGLPPAPPLEPDAARFRLFDSLTVFLKNAATRQPLVLSLDDLHWADQPSLRLLQFLAGELRRSRLLVLGTYRDHEVGRSHPLTQTLAALAREPGSQRIHLAGLAEPEVAQFIQRMAGVNAELEVQARLAEELRQPTYRWSTRLYRATRALLEGRFAEGERLAQEALTLGQRAQQPMAHPIFLSEMYLLYREQRRLGEIEAPLKGYAERFTAAPAWRCGWMQLNYELGREAEARREFERLAAGTSSSCAGIRATSSWPSR